MTQAPASASLAHLAVTAGQATGETVNVSIGARFLHLFSEQLYTSPNKAFEELVSNSWDAGAGVVYIGIPEPLTPQSALWVLDDGVSMDLDGLHLLWAVADDHKARPDWQAPAGRDQIGKFGIGKLATYVLANEVTYVCRDPTGVVRALTVDYREIENRGDRELHVSEIPFEVRVLDEAALNDLAKALDPSGRLSDLLSNARVPYPGEDGAPDAPDAADVQSDADTTERSNGHGEASPPNVDADNASADSQDAPAADATPAVEESRVGGPSEYGHGDGEVPTERRDTWTLVALTSLKDRGLSVKRGVVKRVLRAALPLGETILIVVGDEVLTSSKLDAPLMQTLVLGTDFKPDEVTIDAKKSTEKKYAVKVVDGGLEVEGVSGKITGEIKLYDKSIAGGRSAERARSNGFFVNVLGRVINLHDENFGMPAFSHGVWAKLRITVRADGLNTSLSVSRETVEPTESVRALQALLRAAANSARSYYEDHATWPSLSEILVDKWGTVPLTPLLNTISKVVAGELQDVGLVSVAGVDDPSAATEALRQSVADAPSATLKDVKARHLSEDAPLATYELGSREITVNARHPFYVEQIKGRHEPQEILHTGAMVNLLVDAYLLELGVEASYVEESRTYRDKLERLIAAAHRTSAPVLANSLLKSTGDEKGLETLVGECLDFLGFKVLHQAQSGKPEGIAEARLAPGADEEIRRYRLIYEAKSTTQRSGKVPAKDVNISGQKRHRLKAAADTEDPESEVEYALVVAGDFSTGALEEECDDAGVCPMRARDLARIVMGAGATGPINLAEFEEILKLADPDEVAKAVDDLLEAAKRRVGITIQQLINALREFDNVDSISADVVADRMRKASGEKIPRRADVTSLAQGLAMLVPSGIQVAGSNIILGTSPDRLAEAIRVQAAALPEDHRFGLDELPAMELNKRGSSGS